MNHNVTDSVVYIGVDDKTIDLFESQYVVPNGVSYNSYLIEDEKLAVMDTVDARKTAEWLDNLETALHGRTPDYLVVLHMEPDHAGSIQILDAAVFHHGSDRPHRYRKRRRHTVSGKPDAYVCVCADGALAGGYGGV